MTSYIYNTATEVVDSVRYLSITLFTTWYRIVRVLLSKQSYETALPLEIPVLPNQLFKIAKT